MGCCSSAKAENPLPEAPKEKKKVHLSPQITKSETKIVSPWNPPKKGYERKEEKTVEDNFDYTAPDKFLMDVTESSLQFAKNNTVTRCLNPLGGVVRWARPL